MPPLNKPPNPTLSHTKSSYRTHFPSPSGSPYSKIIVGAAIFHPSPSTTPKILILKRLATEPYYPNVFELPSGNVDDKDATLGDALVREVKEETGLDVVGVEAELESFTYFTEKVAGGQLVRRSCVQLNFVVEVGNGDGKGEGWFEVNEGEHSEGRWVSRDEVDGVEMTDGMRGVVKGALAWKEAQLAKGLDEGGI